MSITGKPTDTNLLEFKIKENLRLNLNPNECILGSRNLSGVRLLGVN